jgi:hypothetical protein
MLRSVCAVLDFISAAVVILLVKLAMSPATARRSAAQSDKPNVITVLQSLQKVIDEAMSHPESGVHSLAAHRG